MYPRVFFAWRNNSVGIYDPVKRIHRRPPKFFVPGTGDIFVLCRDGLFISIEVKRETGIVSQDQFKFIDKVNEFKGYSFVARSLKDVVDRLARMI